MQHCGDLLIKGYGSDVDNVINSEVERRLQRVEGIELTGGEMRLTEGRTSPRTFNPAFAPIRWHRELLGASLARPAVSASASTGTRPAADTRFSPRPPTGSIKSSRLRTSPLPPP